VDPDGGRNWEIEEDLTWQFWSQPALLLLEGVLQ